MASTAANVAIGMEIIAALGTIQILLIGVLLILLRADLFYDIDLNPAVAVFSIFSTQMLGTNIRSFL